MGLKKWHIGFTATALAMATGALGDGATALEGWKLERIHSGSRLLGMPNVSTKPDPKNPTNQFEFHFAGGTAIAPGQALDPSTITAGNDPRLVNDKATCSAFLERNSLPATGDLDDAPALATRTFTLDSGKTFSLQQATFTFTTGEAGGAVSHNMLVCYKVGEKPLTVHDVHVAMGSRFAILLPEDESIVKSTDDGMLAILGNATGRGLNRASHDDDAKGNKTVTPPGAQVDKVSDFSDSGQFVDPRSGRARQAK